jgi:hypothetical protein
MVDTECPLCPCYHAVPMVFKESYSGAENAGKYLKFCIIIFCALKNIKICNISYYSMF